jgi:hypothetical protein
MHAAVHMPLAAGAALSAIAGLLHLGITAVYLIRAFAYAPLAKGGRITPFVVWSSLICLVYGLVHLLGLVQRWPAL